MLLLAVVCLTLSLGPVLAGPQSSPACASYSIQCTNMVDAAQDLANTGSIDKLKNSIGAYSQDIASWNNKISDPTCCFLQEARRCILQTGKDKGTLDKVKTQVDKLDNGFLLEKRNEGALPNCTWPKIDTVVGGLSSASLLSSGLFATLVSAFVLVRLF